MSLNRSHTFVSAVPSHGIAISLLVIGRVLLVAIVRARRGGLIGLCATRRSFRLVTLVNGVALRLLRGSHFKD
jgi:hypothetical protein